MRFALWLLLEILREGARLLVFLIGGLAYLVGLTIEVIREWRRAR